MVKPARIRALNQAPYGPGQQPRGSVGLLHHGKQFWGQETVIV
jgi:hypothetical protein